MDWRPTLPAKSRIAVMKTYKVLNGKFPRSESGRTYQVLDTKDRFLANASKASARTPATLWLPLAAPKTGGRRQRHITEAKFSIGLLR